MSRTNCVYCNKEITARSREHVIHNALGGLYESEDICCSECNNIISRCIDKPFTTIFNPIIGRINNFSKTNNSKSVPPCVGKTIYNNRVYNANIKAGKVVGCPELSRELRADISKLNLPVVAYDFNLQNTEFQSGMGKIAFNYALDQGIDLNLIKHGVKIHRNGANVDNIVFDYPMIPFYPMNPVDDYLELQPNVQLYHNMVLFHQHSHLWCYIDLFNTFQYYVLLSDKMPDREETLATYAQTLQKLDRSEPTLNINTPQDIVRYANKYGVEPCTDPTELARRIKNALSRKSQKMPISDIVADKIYEMYKFYKTNYTEYPYHELLLHQSYKLYFDENNKLRDETFRTQTIAPSGFYPTSYPYAINSALMHDQSDLHIYTKAKFQRLNSLLGARTR